MEIQINELVESLRRDGIESAEKERERILSETREQADEILREAKAQAAEMTAAAKRDAELLRDSAVQDAKQARRDAMLAFRQEVKEEFEKLLKARVSGSLSDSTLGELIRAAVEGQELGFYAAEVNTVSEELQAELAEELKGGLVIRPNRAITAGFRLAATDGSGYFDCSDEEITQMLLPYFRRTL